MAVRDEGGSVSVVASNPVHLTGRDPVREIELFVDPVCPFCWQTSKWLDQVRRQRDLDITYRFISLRMLNEPIGYDDRPPGYPEAHAKGTEYLRVLAAARARHGDDAVDHLYHALGEAIWEVEAPEVDGFRDMLEFHAEGVDVRAALDQAGLDPELAAAMEDVSHDDQIRAETELGQQRAGDDIGTPIITFGPPDGPSFFGPVISDLPDDDEAGELFDAIVKVATWPGFSELKRSLRRFPDVAVAGSMRGTDTTVS